MGTNDCVVCFNEGFIEEQILLILSSWMVCKKHKEEMVELKFGKFKGKEISELAKFEEGIGYLEWLKKETKPTGKYAEANKKLLAEIELHLKDTTQYIPDSQERSIKTKPNEALEILKKVYSDVQLIKQNLGITDKTPKVEEEETLPF